MVESVWLYEESWGMYEDYETKIVGVFSSKQRAEDVAASREPSWPDGLPIYKSITELKLDTVQD